MFGSKLLGITLGCMSSAALLCVGGPAEAQDRFGQAGAAVPRQYAYDLQITSIADGPYLENQPVSVNYTLTVRTFGVARELPAPVRGTICGARKADCKSLGSLSEGRVINGSVSTSAVAGANSPFKISVIAPQVCAAGEECFGTTEVSEAAISRPVAARYMLSIDQFTVLIPRSYQEDTVLVNLFGRVDGQRSAEADACQIEGPPRFCAINIPQGDYSAGTFPATGNAVGPFDLIPEIDPDLKFSYVLLNFGTSYEQRVAEKIFNGISDFTSAGLTAYTGSQGGDSGSWDGLNAFTHRINGIQFGGCDGPVAVDMITALNRAIAGNVAATIDARTGANGIWSAKGPRDLDFYEIESQDGCGRSGRYRVQWTIRRISWLPPVD